MATPAPLRRPWEVKRQDASMPFSPSIESSTTITAQLTGRRPSGSAIQLSMRPVRAIFSQRAFSLSFMRPKSPLQAGRDDTSHCSSVTYLLSIVSALNHLSKKFGLLFGTEIKWLTVMRDKPFVLGPAMNWPKLHFVHHERTRQIIEHAHKKSLLLTEG